MNTRKYPRTLNEAFGPYTSNHIESDDPMPWQDKLVVVVSTVIAIGLLVLVAWGVL